MSNGDALGEVVFSFGRSQALAEGWLIDVTDIAREAGISHPVAVSRRVWDELIVPDELSHRAGQEEMGRLWDVIFLLRMALLRGSAGTEVRYPVAFLFEGSVHRQVSLKAVCGPGDRLEPCITILRTDED